MTNTALPLILMNWQRKLEVTYEPVKIGVLANSENVENAVKWLTKLAEELS